jgi:hypothetical protein
MYMDCNDMADALVETFGGILLIVTFPIWIWRYLYVRVRDGYLE